MRHLKGYKQLFESQQELTQEQKDFLNQCCGMGGNFLSDFIGKWKINPQTGLIDVEGDFHCADMGLTDFKGVRFGKVSGTFACSRNKLTSLVGSPQSVGYNFFCYGNELSTLEGGPKKVIGTYECSSNQLESLKGSPEKAGNFHCYGNNLSSLEGLYPNLEVQDFDCSENKLKSFLGASNIIVKGNFDCSNNNLTSMEGAPKIYGRISPATENPISSSTIRLVLRDMVEGYPTLGEAVSHSWEKIPEEDQIYLAKHNPDLTPEDKRIYRAMELNMKRR